MSSKSLSTKIQRLEGKKDASSGEWAKTAVFEPPEPETLRSRGRLFAVLDFTAPPSFDFSLAERLVFDSLSEKYFSDPDGSPLPALEKALLDVRHQLVNLAVSPKKGGGELDFNLVAAVLWGQVLYLARMGTVAIYLLREGELKEINLGEEKTLATASGLVKPEDVIILGSKGFKKQFPKEKLLSSLESLDRLTESLPHSSGTSALVVKVDFLENLAPSEPVLLVPPLKERFGALAAFFFNLKEKPLALVRNIRSPFLPRRLEATPQVFVRGQPVGESRSRRRGTRFSWVLVLLILAFLGSVAFTIIRHRGEVKQDETAAILGAAESGIREAENQLDWNNIRARELAEKIIADLNRASSFGGEDDRIAAYLGQAQSILDRANKTVRFSNPTLVYDFTLQSPQASVSNFWGSPGTLFVPVPELKNVLQLDISSSPSKVEKVSAEEIADLRWAAASSSFIWLVGEHGLTVVDRADSSLRSDVLEGDFAWNEVANVVAYESFGENLYLLTPAKNQIFKVSYSEEEFFGPDPWIKGEEDLSRAVDLAIDGEIYVLLKDGKVLKFLRGEKEEFGLAFKDFGDPIAIYTDENSEYLYVLDRAKKGIFVFTKEGTYYSQYLYDGSDSVWNEIKDFWVDSEGKAIYILAGTRVFKVGL